MTTILAALASAVLGSGVGCAELLGRYRSRPRAALLSVPGIVYVLLNGGASGSVYAVATTLGWDFGLSGSADGGAMLLVRVIVSSFGTMALLRSSLFTFSQDGASVEAGPAAALTLLRQAVERAVNHQQAVSVINDDWTEGLSFARDHEALTLLCLTALIDPDEASAKALGDLAAKLLVSDSPDRQKMLVYGVALVEQLGATAVVAAGRRIAQENQTSQSVAIATGSAENSPQDTELWKTGQILPADDDEGWRRTARNSALAIEDLLDESKNGVPLGTEMYADLRLQQAAILYDMEPKLSAAAIDRLSAPTGASDVSDLARALFGTVTRLSQDRSKVAESRLGALRPRRPIHQVLTRGVTIIEPPPARAWVYAFALYELWPYLPAELALRSLDSSIEYCQVWDAFVARAAVHLRLGDREAARQDLDVALNGRAGHEPVPPPTVRFWERALRPLRALLDDDLSMETQYALWNAMWDALEAPPMHGADVSRPRPALDQYEPKFVRYPLPVWQRFGAHTAEDLTKCATELAASIDRRSPLPGLTARDFFVRDGAPTPVDAELLVAITAHFKVQARDGAEQKTVNSRAINLRDALAPTDPVD